MFGRKEIGKYFSAEKRENLFLIITGMTAIVLAGICIFLLKNPFYTGAGISFLLTGLLQSVINFFQFIHNDMKHIDHLYNIEMYPSVFKSEELPRMQTVARRYVASRNIKVILLMSGLFFYCNACRGFNSDFISGWGISLTIMSFISFVADQFAINRGNKYLKQLESFTASR